jgi:hypothetical protein
VRGLASEWRRALYAGSAAVAVLALGPAAGAGAVTLNTGDIVIVDREAFAFTGGVIRVDPVSGAQTTVTSGGSFEGVEGVALEADGDILVTSSGLGSGGPSSVIRIDPVSGSQTTCQRAATLTTRGGSRWRPTATSWSPTSSRTG